MLLLIYNTLLTVSILLLLPLIALVILSRAKYRGRTMERLGFKSGTITRKRQKVNRTGPVIWIHALSVGEVTSALPLVKGIRTELEDSLIVFTTATRSGRELANDLLTPYVDLLLYSPFDHPFSIKRTLKAIQPNLFILIETDFWPNWLRLMKKQHIPLLLVNGRISEKSYTAYTRFLFFFKPMFSCFDILSMQTKKDAEKMIGLGIEPDRVCSLGNLKYDMDRGSTTTIPELWQIKQLAAKKTILVCGSTHPGEEEYLFSAFAALCKKNGELYLIIAPRDISRASRLITLAARYGLTGHAFSAKSSTGNVLILDTIGLLASCYSLARVAFVGGSLVEQGGHNPIEPAIHGVPVLFGRYMEDFSEIAQDLIIAGGAKQVSQDSLTEILAELLEDDALHTAMSTAGQALVNRQQGTVGRHLKVIRSLLHP